MKKNTFIFIKKLLSIIGLLFFLGLPTFADENGPGRIIDNAGLLGLQQRESLSRIIESVERNYRFGLVIVTEESIGRAKPEEYSAYFFEHGGYGLGESQSGALFLLAMDSREYWLYASGRGAELLNPHAFDKLQADSAKLLRGGKYSEAFHAFASNWENFLRLDSKGKSYNFLRRYHLLLVCAAWALAFAIGFGIVQFWKQAMNSVIPRLKATGYTVPGSLSFKEKKDKFLYSKVTKIPRQNTPGQGPTGRGGIAGGLKGSAGPIGASRGGMGRKSSGRGGKFKAGGSKRLRPRAGRQ
jgi:uncharacterized protein